MARENRVANSLTYKSPWFADFQLALTYIAEDSVDDEDAYSVGVRYGDKDLKI